MRLIDTSAWIHALRADGDSAVASRVRALLEMGEAAWCPMVQLELWNGARGDRARRFPRRTF
jgi:predicted nucleic acid-binding protein